MRRIKSDDNIPFLKQCDGTMAFSIAFDTHLEATLATDRQSYIGIFYQLRHSLTTIFKRKKSYVSSKKFLGPYFIAPWFYLSCNCL